MCPHNTTSEFYNYKGFYSIVLLALVDYDYKFIYADIGCQGRISDGGVYRNCTFYNALRNNELDLPALRPLSCLNRTWIPYHSNVPLPMCL